MFIFPYSFWSAGGVSLNNLVSYYKLDNNGNDSHGANHLSNQGSPSYVAGRKSNAVNRIVESDDYLYIDANTSLSINGNRTFAFWIYPRDTSIYEHCLVKYSDVGLDWEYLIHMWPGGNYLEMYMYVDGVGTYVSVNTTADVVQNQWNLGIFWIDVSNTTMYCQVNNKAINSSSFATYSPYTSNARFIVGARESPIGAGANCIMDEVGVWDRVLSPSERAALWNNGNGRTYPFNT